MGRCFLLQGKCIQTSGFPCKDCVKTSKFKKALAKVKPELAKLTCEWCNNNFTHPKIYPEDVEKYRIGGGVICPHCWRFTNPNKKFW